MPRVTRLTEGAGPQRARRSPPQLRTGERGVGGWGPCLTSTVPRQVPVPLALLGSMGGLQTAPMRCSFQPLSLGTSSGRFLGRREAVRLRLRPPPFSRLSLR